MKKRKRWDALIDRKFVLDEELPRETVNYTWICPDQKLVCKDGKTWEPQE